jgi:peptidyl-prolyl cis-trans isomerase B (cyclophilin B)
LSGQKNKRNKRLERERAREEARRQQRRQTMFTLIVIGVVVAIGGVLIAISLEDPDPLAEEAEEPFDEATEPAEVDREVACGAEAPPQAGEEKPTYDAPEDVLEDGVDYVATIDTSCGTVVVDLHEEEAPRTVNSFVFLAQEGFFDGLEIFRNAASIGALQTGAGTNEAAFDVGYTLPDELDLAVEEGYPPGSVAMANAGPDTAGSQFFFVYNEQFDDAFAERRDYARFGMVTEGLDVLEEIGAIPVGDTPETAERPQEIVYINSVTIGVAGAAAEGEAEDADTEGS